MSANSSEIDKAKKSRYRPNALPGPAKTCRPTGTLYGRQCLLQSPQQVKTITCPVKNGQLVVLVNLMSPDGIMLSDELTDGIKIRVTIKLPNVENNVTAVLSVENSSDNNDNSTAIGAGQTPRSVQLWPNQPDHSNA